MAETSNGMDVDNSKVSFLDINQLASIFAYTANSESRTVLDRALDVAFDRLSRLNDGRKFLTALVVYGELRMLVRVQFGLRLKEILAARGDATDDETFVGSVKFFCPGYGFADAHTILGDELTAAFDTDRSKEFDLAVCLVPNNVVGDKLCNDLDAIASEARRIGKRIKERNISNLAAQERITQLLLRLDSVVTTPTTRPLRRMQVRQLLALSKSTSLVAAGQSLLVEAISDERESARLRAKRLAKQDSLDDLSDI